MTLVDAASRQLSLLEALELRLLPDDGVLFEEAVPVAWLAETLRLGLPKNGLRFEVTDPGRARLEVQPLGPVDERPPIRVRGRLEAVVRTDCVRCLEQVHPALDADIDLTLLPGPAEAADAPRAGRAKRAKIDEDDRLEDWSGDAFPDPDALGEAQYRGERLDLPQLLAEALLMALTTDPTCEDAGLDLAGCDQRTAALIEAANRPVRDAEADVDPRWAALKNLKLDDEDPS